MSELLFRHPEAAWALVAAALLLAVGRALRRPRFAAIGIPVLLAGPAHRASRVRRAPAALAAAALASIVVALMDPVRQFSEETVASRGLDIVLVLDLSSSMEELMGGGADRRGRDTRLDVTKRAIADFIARRRNDRVGLIVFSDYAYVVSPLTFDHAYLQRYVAMIDAEALRSEGMTAIGEGITVANTLLDRQAAGDARRNRAIVIFTDGENNYGRDPVDALEEAHAARHRVHLVGVDLADDVKRKPDVLRLVRTVERRGGRYFNADTRGELAAASRAIDALETGMLVTTRYVRDAPAFDLFAAAAVVLVCGALLLRALPFFVDHT